MPALPEWQPLDQIGSTVSEGANGGRVVGIVASRAAVSAGWAGDAAVSLARAWSEAGQKVVLVDGALGSPTLHVATGVDNGEGLTDATLFGASVGRVAQSVESGAFFLVTAGTVVADGNAVIKSPRWDQISKSSVEAGVTLGVFLRDGDPATPAFLGSASEIVVLSASGDEPPAAVRDLEPLVSIVTGPTGAAALAGPAQAAASPAGSAGELSAAALKATAASGRTRMAMLLLAVVLLVAVLLAVFGVITIPGLTPQSAVPAVTPDLASALTSGTG